jgi:hypothetical protein
MSSRDCTTSRHRYFVETSSPLLAAGGFALAAADDQKGQKKTRNYPKNRLQCCSVHNSFSLIGVVVVMQRRAPNPGALAARAPELLRKPADF